MADPRLSIIPARAVFDKRLAPAELRTLAALGSYTDNQGWCFPNQSTLARRLDLSRQTVSRSVGKLVGFGYLSTEVRTTRGRGKSGYLYRVLMDSPSKPDVAKTRHRELPMSAPADVGASPEPMSPEPDIGIEERSQYNDPIDSPLRPPKGATARKSAKPKSKAKKRAAAERALPSKTARRRTVTLALPFDGRSEERDLALGDLKMTEAEFTESRAGFIAWASVDGRRTQGEPNWDLAFRNHLRRDARSWGTAYRKQPAPFRGRGSSGHGAELPAGPPWWRKLAEEWLAHDSGEWLAWWSSCTPAENGAIAVHPANTIARDRLNQDLVWKAERLFGLKVGVLEVRQGGGAVRSRPVTSSLAGAAMRRRMRRETLASPQSVSVVDVTAD